MYAETIICKLYEARTDLGLTQQQVADGADMNVRTLINIEKGRNIPSLLYAIKLAKFFYISVNQLFEYPSIDHALDKKSYFRFRKKCSNIIHIVFITRKLLLLP